MVTAETEKRGHQLVDRDPLLRLEELQDPPAPLLDEEPRRLRLRHGPTPPASRCARRRILAGDLARPARSPRPAVAPQARA